MSVERINFIKFMKKQKILITGAHIWDLVRNKISKSRSYSYFVDIIKYDKNSFTLILF